MNILRAIKINQITSQYTLEDLVDTYGDSLYRFCRSLTYSKEDADDLFQETFLMILEQLPKINNYENPQGFLFSTSLYIWKSWKRKYARRKRLVPTEPLNDTVVDDINIEESIILKEEINIVRKIVEALPSKYKIPIILYYTIEMSTQDIAVTLNLPVGTIKSRLFKARKIVEKGLVANKYEK